jgi:tetratricopeptide (TPR) repeat protein
MGRAQRRRSSRVLEPGAAPRPTSHRLAWAVAALALLARANALGNGFTFDDEWQILGNPWLASLQHLPEIFGSNVWGFRPGLVSNYYRPLMHVFYLAVVQVFGLRAWAFHLLSMLFHAGTALLVFRLVDALAPGPADAPALRRHAPALAAGLLFAVHPIHTEAVAWAAALPEVSFTFFTLLALGLFVRGTHRMAGPLAAVAFLAALLCKETAVALFPLLIAYQRVSGQAPGREAHAGRFLWPAGAAAVYGALRLGALGGGSAMPVLPPYGTLAPAAYLANVLQFLAHYVALLLVPANLAVIHGFPLLQSPLQAPALAGLAVAVGGALALAVTWQRRSPLLVALTLIAAPLAPTVLVPAYSLVPFSERYLYLPSVGLALLVGLAAQRLQARGGRRALAAAAGLGLVGVLFLAGAWQRNRVWRDDLSLFADSVAKSPVGEINNGMLGLALNRAGRYAEAIEPLRRALDVNPRSGRARYQLGHALLKAGHAGEAIPELERAWTLSPGLEVRLDLADALEIEGRLAQAIVQREAIVAVAAADPAQRNLLGIAYGKAGRVADAAAQFEAAIQLAPDEPAYRRNLARVKPAP